MNNAQELTSRALNLAATPYQQSGAREDVLAPRAKVVSPCYCDSAYHPAGHAF